MQVKVKLLSLTAKLPYIATPGAAAADLFADLNEPLTLQPGQRYAVPTGISVQPVGENVALFVFARSGLGIKHGITLANGVGVIDSDYRGEIKVGLLNTSDTSYTVNPGDRIAQLAVLPVVAAEYVLSESLDDSERGTGGLGSTGNR